MIQSCDFYPTLLELLGIDAQPDQTFDGVSIVPALQGKSLDREAIFTYFPHCAGRSRLAAAVCQRSLRRLEADPHLPWWR